MIDLHTHFLPGIDDGAQVLSESFALARAALRAGITLAVMTPHVHPGRYCNTRASIHTAVRQFQRALAAEAIPLDVRAGGEVRLCDDLMRMVEAGEVPYLGVCDGYRTLLLEFPPGHLMVGGENLVQWLLGQRIRPVIAHPERNKEIVRDIGKLHPYVALGCKVQLTAGSVLGQFGKPVRDCALRLLEREWVTVVASDAHSMEHRPPNLDVARAALVEMGGEMWAGELTERAPAAVLGLS